MVPADVSKEPSAFVLKKVQVVILTTVLLNQADERTSNFARIRIIWKEVKQTLRIMKYRVSQKELTKLREGVPYVKLYRYNPKHLYPKLNGYGDNGKRSLKL